MTKESADYKRYGVPVMYRKQYYVYFMTNAHNTTPYTGVTGNLQIRVHEHKSGTNPDSFTDKFNCTKLVYFETYDYIDLAIEREKKLKRWNRAWKNALVNEGNPQWMDLSAKW